MQHAASPNQPGREVRTSGSVRSVTDIPDRSTRFQAINGVDTIMKLSWYHTLLLTGALLIGTMTQTANAASAIWQNLYSTNAISHRSVYDWYSRCWDGNDLYMGKWQQSYRMIISDTSKRVNGKCIHFVSARTHAGLHRLWRIDGSVYCCKWN